MLQNPTLIAEKNKAQNNKAMSTVLVVAALVFLLPTPAHAGNLAGILCSVVILIQSGGIASAIATLIIMTMGISAMLGKVSWGMALIVATGIGIIFGAGSILALLGIANACNAT